MKVFSLIIFAFFVVWKSISQNEFTQTLRGIIIDSKTELPLPGATVFIPGTDPLVGTTTDIDGHFRIERIQVGRVNLMITFVGYQPVQLFNLIISTGKETVLTIRLEEAVLSVDEIEVRPEIRKDRPVNEMALASARSFTIEETERYAGSLGDPSRMAANFAGVSSASDQRNDIIIRGNSPMGLSWRLEGIEIPNPNHFGNMGSTGGPVSMLNNNLLSNSDFYTGAFPAEFGNALAGAFDLKMRNGNNQKHEFIGQVGFNGFEAGTEGPLSQKNGSSYLINFRYSTLEVFKALGMSFGTGQAVPQYKDLSYKINLPTTKIGRFTIFGVGGLSYIEMLDSRGDSASFGFAGTDLYFGSDMGVTGIAHTGYLSPHTRINSSIAVSGVRNDSKILFLDDEHGMPKFLESYKEIRTTFSGKVSHKFDSRNHLQGGAVYEHFNIDYDGKEYVNSLNSYFSYYSTKGRMEQIRVFGDFQRRFSDHLTLNTGVHSQVLLMNGTWSFEPRVAARWQAFYNGSFSVGAGMHSQAQPRAIYFMQQLTDTVNNIFTYTNKELDFARSIHFVTGYDHLFNNQLRMKIEAYYQYLYKLPVAVQRPEYSTIITGGGFTYWVYHHLVNQGTGQNYGLEFTLEKFLHQGFYYLLTASVFDATYKGWDGVRRNSSFNNNFIFNALAGYEANIGQRHVLAFDLKGILAGGARYVPIDEELSKSRDEAVYLWDKAFVNRHPNYFRINMRITYRLNSKKVNQEWAIDLQNLTNHRNIFTQNWNSYKKEVSTSYQMEFMPMMTYKIHF